jgi:multidrug efflux pump subunit AcrB
MYRRDGRPGPGEAVLDMRNGSINPMPRGTRAEWAGEGEWKITLRVFRDMGIAFAAALTGIYILLIVQTGSFFMPLLDHDGHPLTLIGAMPGFWLLNLITGGSRGRVCRSGLFHGHRHDRHDRPGRHRHPQLHGAD